MKTRTWLLLLLALLAVSLGLGAMLLTAGPEAVRAEIRSDGELIATVDLRIDQEFTVTTPWGGENVVTVRSGAIAVTSANCPDHYCMHRGFCNSGGSIVCLPNKLVISFVGEQDVDFAA
ncbi:MAG: NusG domain II-containing protein [Candidatus Faecousia sp.]|nr:NusG domain II-containing protein [Candidatus Faecousia sp.]